MIKKILLSLVVLIVIVVGVLYAQGKGMFGGGPWESAPVADGPRPLTTPLEAEAQILDLHHEVA